MPNCINSRCGFDVDDALQVVDILIYKGREELEVSKNSKPISNNSSERH